MKCTLTTSKAAFLSAFNWDGQRCLPIHPNTNFANDLIYTVSDRAVCETDESLLQPIPYMAIKDINTGKYFFYKRGKASGETRLMGQCSIGIGGHIEELYPDQSILDSFAMGALREIHEEIGLPINEENLTLVKDALVNNRYHLIYDDSTAANRVHLGVFMVLEVNGNHLGEHEEDYIVNGEWLAEEELRQMAVHPDSPLESWSKILVNFL